MPKEFLDDGLNKIVRRLTGIKRLLDKLAMDGYAKDVASLDKTDKNVQERLMQVEEKVNTDVCLVYSPIVSVRHFAI